MPAIERLGDPNTGGGTVKVIPQNTVFANNLLVSVNGSTVSKHGKNRHKAPSTANGSKNVFVNNIAINRVGDSDTCGHSRAGGSRNVFVN